MYCSAIPWDLPSLCSGKQECKLRKCSRSHTNRDTHTPTLSTQRDKHDHSFFCPMTHFVLLFFFSAVAFLHLSLSLNLFPKWIFPFLCGYSAGASSFTALSSSFAIPPSSFTFITYTRHCLFSYIFLFLSSVYTPFSSPSLQTVNTGRISVALFLFMNDCISHQAL